MHGTKSVAKRDFCLTSTMCVFDKAFHGGGHVFFFFFPNSTFDTKSNTPNDVGETKVCMYDASIFTVLQCLLLCFLVYPVVCTKTYSLIIVIRGSPVRLRMPLWEENSYQVPGRE